jgi:hypothetical protein
VSVLGIPPLRARELRAREKKKGRSKMRLVDAWATARLGTVMLLATASVPVIASTEPDLGARAAAAPINQVAAAAYRLVGPSARSVRVPAGLQAAIGKTLVDRAVTSGAITNGPFIAPSPAPAVTFTGSPTAQLGYSVALSANGRVALVGAPGTDASGDELGAAYVYNERGAKWSTTPTATFTSRSGAGLGSAVALSADGRVALVGADAYGDYSGSAYVYDEVGGRWSATPAATFTGYSDASAKLGSSVALSANGQVALVGAPGTSSGDGAAFIYNEAAGRWPTTPGAMFVGSPDSGAYLGSSVALSANGQVALVAAPVTSSYRGAAYVYGKSGGSWSTTPAATFTGASAGTQLGSSVALSADGQVALVGADTTGSNSGGAAYVYGKPGGSWSTTPAATFTDRSLARLGSAVVLSANGRVALVGAFVGSSYQQGGAADIYDESGGKWSARPAATFTGSTGMGLGCSVALSANGEVALVGTYAGGAYIYMPRDS